MFRFAWIWAALDNQSVEEESLGFMPGFVRTEARSSGKLRRDIAT